MRAMFDKLPDLIDPVYSAQHNKQFVARVNQARFPRLKEQLISAENDVEVNVQFYYHKQFKMHAFDLQLKTVFVLECQRSLKPFDYPVASSVTGVFVESAALAEDLPSEVEVYELSEEKISLIELIEDELLLNIPLAAINDQSEMAYDNQLEDEKTSLEVDELEKKENPFAVLQGLKNNPN
uniref:Large ribosomal RNA subunit accumulation protein YceD n=1 Tax=Hydrogenovibrio crunogenus (strain DSM 25203 / XCL-2) TaxID=317025 RepID=Q31HS0_HYDCU